MSYSAENNTFYGGEKQKCFFVQLNRHLPNYVYLSNIITALINGLVSIPTIAGNALVIVSIWRARALHCPSSVLLCCLASSDLFTGLFSQPSYVAYKVTEMQGSLISYCLSTLLLEIAALTGSGVTMFTLTAVSVDRYLSLFHPLRYYTLVTTPRVLKTFAFIVIFVCGATMIRLAPFLDGPGVLIVSAFIGLSLFTSTLVYLKILLLVRWQRNRVRSETVAARANRGGGAIEASILRKRKGASTMGLVFVLFLASFFPLLCCMIAFNFVGLTTPVKIAFNICSTFSFVNSLLNPLLYCWRMNDIRRAIKRNIRLAFARCCCFSHMPVSVEPCTDVRLELELKTVPPRKISELQRNEELVVVKDADLKLAKHILRS